MDDPYSDNFYDEEWGSDYYHLGPYCELMFIESMEQATNYIEEAVKDATVRELEKLEIAVFGRVRTKLRDDDPSRYLVLSKRGIKEPWVAATARRSDDEPTVLYGGFPSDPNMFPTDISGADPNIVKLLELGDAIHDFGNKMRPNKSGDNTVTPETDEEYSNRVENNRIMRRLMFESIGARVPQEISRGLDDLDDILARIADKGDFIRVMTTSERLTFSNGAPVPNPLFGRKIEELVSKTGPGPMKMSHSKDVTCVDIYFEQSSTGKKIVVLTEISKLRRKMEEFFTTKSSMEMLKQMELNIMVDQCMHPRDRFMNGREEPTRALFDWIRGFKIMLAALTKYFEVPSGKAITGDEIERMATLKEWYCDASLYDGAKVASWQHFSPNPTGDVFHNQAEVHITFTHASKTGYTYRIETVHPTLNPLPWSYASDDEVSTENGFITGTGTRDDSSTATMEHYIQLMSGWGDEYRFAVPAALKRAGDWGQIEHCKKNNIVFVTADRLTAMYAAFRDVPVLFIKHAESDQDDDGHKKYAQFSFVMCGSQAARSRCCPKRASIATGSRVAAWSQLGGWELPELSGVWLWTVAILCAVAGSMYNK